MSRITETNYTVVGVTVSMVYIAEDINIYWSTFQSEVYLALMWLRLRKYVEFKVRLDTVGKVWDLW